MFVLATTDPQKVLPTIRSRTQHFEFHLLGTDTLVALLGDIAADAKLDLPDDGLEVAVRRGRGSARDALSVLDQVMAAGVTDDELPVLAELVGALAERDTARALGAVAAAVEGGRDPHRLAVDLVEELRRGFLLIAAPQVAAGLEGTSGLAEAPAEQVRQLGLARCVRAIETIGATQVDMRSAADPRITLEVALARLTHPEADDSTAALLERVERLERALREREERPPSAGGAGAAAGAAAAAAASGPASAASGTAPGVAPAAGRCCPRSAAPEVLPRRCGCRRSERSGSDARRQHAALETGAGCLPAVTNRYCTTGTHLQQNRNIFDTGASGGPGGCGPTGRRRGDRRIELAS